MKFSLALPTDHHAAPDEFVTGSAITAIATAAESSGWDAVFVTDHPAPDTRWLAGGGHQALEPTVALAAAAAVTTRLRLHTNIYVLAYRNPFLAARSLASVERISGGRMIVGVAAGYLRAEFAALGVPFEERNERLDEALGLLRRLWAGEEVAGEGLGWLARGVQQLPVPVSDGSPTVWVGGNSTAAMRRAARFADGWSPFPTAPQLSKTAKTADISTIEELAERIGTFRRLCEDAGRDEPLDICFGSFSGARYATGEASSAELLDELGRLEDLGVNWITVTVPGDSVAAMVDGLERYAAEIIRPLAAS